MGRVLKEGMSGQDVLELQEALLLAGFPAGNIDGAFGPGTEAAVLGFQRSQGLLADGIVGRRTLTALELAADIPVSDVFSQVTIRVVSKMFPFTPLDNIKRYTPNILASLGSADLCDSSMVLMAFSTIRAEAECFKPIDEGISRYNTSPGGRPFDLYDNRRDLGNRGRPDGERYKGRGFVQLTGRYNYQRYGKLLGMGNHLLDKPEQANDDITAANLLAFFLKDKEVPIKQALLNRDFLRARQLVNGGSHGIDRFTECFKIGEKYIQD